MSMPVSQEFPKGAEVARLIRLVLSALRAYIPNRTTPPPFEWLVGKSVVFASLLVVMLAKRPGEEYFELR